MAILTDIPHFDLPFRFGTNGHAVVVEQDTYNDIRNCVIAIVRTEVGQREEMPDFGIPDLAFELQPLPIDEITEAVLRDEPRAGVILEQQPDFIDNTIAEVLLQVSAPDASYDNSTITDVTTLLGAGPLDLTWDSGTYDEGPYDAA